MSISENEDSLSLGRLNGPAFQDQNSNRSENSSMPSETPAIPSQKATVDPSDKIDLAVQSLHASRKRSEVACISE